MTTISIAWRTLCCAALLAGAATSHAAGDTGSAESRYQQDREACLSGHTQQARDVCLREAGAARDAASKGALQDSSDKAGNAVARCEVFKKADAHAACLDRMRGAGNTSGSALQGGVLRESVTTTTTTTEPQ